MATTTNETTRRVEMSERDAVALRHFARYALAYHRTGKPMVVSPKEAALLERVHEALAHVEGG